ncbi:MAG: glycosyltransferase family 4 protein [Acidobacteria bacterium]|nr:glycosyltransferase family 4 protein [Acidobacteriota bacterium]
MDEESVVGTRSGRDLFCHIVRSHRLEKLAGLRYSLLPMRILVLSQYYTPEPVAKPAELAEALRDAGHDVCVLTGLPNYPSGQLYPGYRSRLRAADSINGIPVVRTYEFPYHGTNVFGRVANYLSFMCSAPLGLRLLPRFDVIYVWHPPLTIGIAAWLVARARRVPFVYDVQDIWPESAVVAGILKRRSLAVGLLGLLERFVYSRARHILVVTDEAGCNLAAKGVPTDKLSIAPNWVDTAQFARDLRSDSEEIRKRYGWNNRFVLLFAGNMGLVQGLATVLDAAARIPSESRSLFVLIGDGSDRRRLESLVAQMEIQARVQFIDRQPASAIPAFLAAADALLVHLNRSSLSQYVIPTKTLSYLAAGRPILMATEGPAADLVRSAGAGSVVPPEDPIALADASVALESMTAADRDRMGTAGRAYAAAHFGKAVIIPRYERILADAAR